jgi:7-keto-8-aminopelargonate synthetase-like enzyme
MSFDPAAIEQFITTDLADRAQRSLLRSRRAVTRLTPTSVRIGDTAYVDFASNNYLGLTHHPAVIDAVRRAAQDFGIGSGPRR